MIPQRRVSIDVLSVCASVWRCTCSRMHVCVVCREVSVWGLSQLLPTLIFGAGSLTCPGARWFSKISSQPRLRDLPVSTSLALGTEACTTVSSFSQECWRHWTQSLTLTLQALCQLSPLASPSSFLLLNPHTYITWFHALKWQSDGCHLDTCTFDRYTFWRRDTHPCPCSLTPGRNGASRSSRPLEQGMMSPKFSVSWFRV